MISAADRAARTARYKELDPEALYQSIGYDYLTDETGLLLEPIPPERGFAGGDQDLAPASRVPG